MRRLESLGAAVARTRRGGPRLIERLEERQAKHVIEVQVSDGGGTGEGPRLVPFTAEGGDTGTEVEENRRLPGGFHRD